MHNEYTVVYGYLPINATNTLLNDDVVSHCSNVHYYAVQSMYGFLRVTVKVIESIQKY